MNDKVLDIRNCSYEELFSESWKYNLAICDIPYGKNVGNMAFLSETNTTVKQKNGTRINPNKGKMVYENKDWDKIVPGQDYFDALKKISDNQIIFGIDYTNWLGVSPGRIKWNKGFSDGVSLYETDYCSLIDYERELPLLWAGMQQAKSLNEPMVQQGNKKLNEKRIHPCHKPILLYIRLLLDYAKKGDSIVDTHIGGMSIAIAVLLCNELYNMNLTLTATELDKDYYTAGMKRIEEFKNKRTLFTL